MQALILFDISVIFEYRCPIYNCDGANNMILNMINSKLHFPYIDL